MQFVHQNDIPPERSYITLYQQMMKGEHTLLSPLCEQFQYAEDLEKIARHALSNTRNIRDVTFFMAVNESVGHCWHEQQFYNYDNAIFTYAGYKSLSTKNKLYDAYTDELALTFNNTSSVKLQKICYEGLYGLNNETYLKDKIIHLDCNKVQQYAKNKIDATKKLFIEKEEAKNSWENIFLNIKPKIIN